MSRPSLLPVPAWRRLSLRARLLLVGVLGLAGALALGSLALYAVLTVLSLHTLDASAAATASEVGSLVEAGRLPDPIPVVGDQVVQVVDGQDRVVSSSLGADRLTALLLPQEVRAALRSPVRVPGSRIAGDSPLRVTALQVHPPPDSGSSPGARRTVVVGQPVGDLEHSQHILGWTLLATYPLLLAVLAAIAWRVVGATLRPVEALRATAEQVSGSGQDARLPVPASRDEIHALAVTLNSMLDRLAGARERQRSFVADAAHELRSPLASMQAQLDVAERLGDRLGERRGEDPAVARDLRTDVRRMTTLVEDLLVLARLDGDSPPRRPPEPVPVRPLVEEVLARYAGARVPVTAGRVDDVAALGWSADLRRVLENLLDNAVRHAAAHVRVEAHDSGVEVELTVNDDGEGIPAAQRDRVFDRFTRLDEARDRDAGGTGLGLAIVAGLVTRMGGTVSLHDAEGGGLLVRLRLPGVDGAT